MDFIQTVVLALIQGISEFLPISSSAHLILMPQLSDWSDQGLAFDVVVHMGTLVAVVYYYKHVIFQLLSDFYFSIVKGKTIGESKMAWGVLLATIPVGVCGFLFKDVIATDLRSVETIAYMSIVFGILLGIAVLLDATRPHARDLLVWKDMIFIGLMQTLALVPGVSRSGITITVGLLIGLSRKSSVQFAFLLSIPVITLSVLLVLIDIYQDQQMVNLTLLVVGFVVSIVSAYLAIVFFIKALEAMSMMPFVVYRLCLGVFLLLL